MTIVGLLGRCKGDCFENASVRDVGRREVRKRADRLVPVSVRIT